MDIILYLLQFIQYQHKQICWLLNFICRYIPLKQWAHDDSNSPKYQKFKIDELPLILNVEPWDYQDFMAYLITGNMISLSNQFNAVMANPFPKIPSALYVELLTTLFTIIMAVTGSISAMFVGRLSALGTSSLYPFVSPALTVVTPLLLRKTVNFSAFINV